MSSSFKLCIITLLLVSLLPIFGTPVSAQALPPGQPPPQKPIEPSATREKDAGYSDEAFVVHELSTSYRYEKDGTGQRELGLKVKIQNEAGVQAFGQLVFPYSSANENLELDFIRVLKADGSVVTASASNVQDLSAPIAREAPIYTDLRQKHVTVPGLRPGDVLEYRVISRVHTPLAVNHFWLEHNFITKGLIVLNELLSVNIPRDSKVKLKMEPGVDPVVKEEEGRRIYAWKHANLKREESDKKDEEEDLTDEDKDDPKRPQVQMTTFQSWDEVGRWYADLERDRIVPDEKIRARVQELVRGRNTDKEKVAALYDFVAKNFRYVSLSLGQGRYQPHAAMEVMANQYGDCKDKHTLLSAMLIAAGLRAYPVLMNSRRKIDDEVPSPGQFDHVISAIPIAGETLWADTTSEVAPFQLLAASLRDKKALLIPAAGAARLETTPANPPFSSTEVIEVEGEVSELGKLSGHSRLKLRGDAELLFRIVFRRTPRSDWKQIGEYLAFMGGLFAEVSEIKPSDPAATEQPFEIEYDFTRDDFLDWAGKKANLNLPMPPIHMVAVPSDQEDSKPLKLGSPIQITYRLKLALPEKYEVRIPLPVKLTRDYAEYSSTYKLEGRTLIAERVLQLRQRELPATRLQDYRAFVAARRADEAQTVAVESSLAGAPKIPDSIKVEELVQAAAAASKNENYAVAEDLLKRVLEKEPKHKSARRDLGWALFAQRKFEPAIEVLNEQTKINDFDDYAYNLLGRTYWQLQKYSEAEIAFRKQIEITPLDKWARGNLGQMLVEWRKYKEAVPELEQAISLNPEAVALPISLGRAYLNLGQTEKGIEAFDKAIKLSPGPAVWNDVSYNLALSNVQLDKAQQYAESAVTAVAMELRNVELSNLTTANVQHVGALVAYWDTLGWVHFQKGNMELAEKYIRAAWTVGQHGEVGYHLGQILEKRGQKEEAIQAYALATAAWRTVPEALDSLKRLVGKEKSDALAMKANQELNAARTISFPAINAVKGASEAQFFVVLTPGTARSAQVTDVKFISGDEKLKAVAGDLKAANFNFVFPDDTATKVIRRGTLFCQPAGNRCSFIMLVTDTVTVD